MLAFVSIAAILRSAIKGGGMLKNTAKYSIERERMRGADADKETARNGMEGDGCLKIRADTGGGCLKITGENR